MTPDPSAPPTVATFGGASASPAPPAGVPSGPPRMSPGDFEQARAAAAQAASMAAAPPTQTLDPNKMLGMLEKLTQLNKQQQRAAPKPEAPAAPQAQRQPAPRQLVKAPEVLSPEERLRRFAKDGNEYGVRLENFLRVHIPGVNFGITFEVGEEGTVDHIRVGSFLFTVDSEGNEVTHSLAEVGADTDALGEAIVQVVQATQEALESMDAGELQKDVW